MIISRMALAELKKNAVTSEIQVYSAAVVPVRWQAPETCAMRQLPISNRRLLAGRRAKSLEKRSPPF
jgi:hypothetical protein